MPEFHAEPYLHLAGLSHKSALIAWGAFYFKTRTHPSTSLAARTRWKLVDDRDLRHVHPPRRESIGARSDPYGPARVNVYDTAGALVSTTFTETTNFCWVTGLSPNTEYRYRVTMSVPGGSTKTVDVFARLPAAASAGNNMVSKSEVPFVACTNNVDPLICAVAEAQASVTATT